MTALPLFPSRAAARTGPARVAPAPAARPGHNPLLDGVRGLAVLLVMAGHLMVMGGATTLDRVLAHAGGMGWIGVDLFFVLSGFLITGILFDAKGSANYFRNFYARRTLRIFPLYYLVVFACVFLLPQVLPAAAEAAGSPQIAGVIREKMGRLEGLEGNEHWFWLYLSNIPMALQGTYVHSILGVSWSLAIEEQFYLVWPAVVFLCSRRTLMRACLWMFGLALVWRTGLALAGANHVAIYVSTFSRMDALATGAFIALAVRGPVGFDAKAWACRLRPWALGCALLAAIICAAEALVPTYELDHGTGHGPVFLTAGLTLMSLMFGSLLVMVLASDGRSRLGRFFASRPMRVFGTYSYALYLFHQPIKALFRDLIFGPAGTAARIKFPTLLGSELPGQLAFYALVIAVCLGAAVASWYLFELQFLKLKRYFPASKPAGAGLESGTTGVPTAVPATA